jgi:hypothetical protein
MKAIEKIQRAKVGKAGSFFNQMMSNNRTVPVVGMGATQMFYSDRECFEVVEVSADGKSARLQYLDAVAKKSGQPYGSQEWDLVPTDRYVTVVWRQNAWRTVGRKIEFTKEFRKQCEAEGIQYIGNHIRKTNPELNAAIWGTEGEPFPQNVVEGYTREAKVYEKINIIFGVKDYHYDFSF